MNERADITLCDAAAYGSDRWCALTLGWPLSKFKRERPKLEREGFPAVDPLIGLTLKADVQTWLVKRQRQAQHVPARNTDRGANLNEL